MSWGGRDIARATYERIAVQPAVRRVVAPQPVQPELNEPTKEAIASHYASNAVRSFARRYGRVPSEREVRRIAHNAAEMAEAIYGRDV